jgi:hypothetical protein
MQRGSRNGDDDAASLIRRRSGKNVHWNQRSKLVVASGTGGHICELFAENPHWRKRITELSRLCTDALNVAMERGGGTDD